MKTNERIKNLRKDRDLTQKAVADKLFMQVTQYRRYETGEREMPVEIAIAIAKLYDVSLDYLLGLTMYDNNIEINKLSVEDKTLLTLFHRLSQINKAKLVERAEVLLENQK